MQQFKNGNIYLTLQNRWNINISKSNLLCTHIYKGYLNPSCCMYHVHYIHSKPLIITLYTQKYFWIHILLLLLFTCANLFLCSKMSNVIK